MHRIIPKSWLTEHSLNVSSSFQTVQSTFDFFELDGDIHDSFANHTIIGSPETTESHHFDIG